MEQRIKEQIEYDVLAQEHSKEMLDGIVTLLTDTVCGNAPTVRIGGNDIPREAVRSRLSHLSPMKSTKTDIWRMWQYRAEKSATVTSIDFVLPSVTTKIGAICRRWFHPHTPEKNK